MDETTTERLNELYDLREAIETHVVGTLVENLRPEDQQELSELNQELIEILDVAREDGWTQEYRERWLLAEAAFHLVLLRATGNRKMMWVMERFGVMQGIFGHLRGRVDTTDHERIQRQHRELLEAVAGGDAASARKVVTEHLQIGRERALGIARQSLSKFLTYGDCNHAVSNSDGPTSLVNRLTELQRHLAFDESDQGVDR